MTDEAKALVEECRLDAKAFRENTVYDSDGDPIRLIANADRLDQYADLIETQAREIERLRRDRDDLLTFAKAIQIWRSDADSYDRECDHPQRNYCEDVELMEGCADIVVRRVIARAALGDRHDQ